MKPKKSRGKGGRRGRAPGKPDNRAGQATPDPLGRAAESAPARSRSTAPRDPFTRCEAFLALEPSTQVSSALLELQRRLDRRIPHESNGLCWIDPRTLRVNVRQIGPVIIEKLEPLREELTALLAQTPSFATRITGVAPWPDNDAPRALWALVEALPLGLIALRKALDERLRALGFAPPDHPFRPHLTLALLDDNANLRDELPQLIQNVPRNLQSRFWISELLLLVRPVGDDGAPFQIADRIRLAPVEPSTRAREEPPELQRPSMFPRPARSAPEE